MEKYIKFVLKYPKFILLFFFILTVFMGSGLLKLEMDNSIEAFMPQEDSEYLYYNKVRDQFGDNGRFYIMSVSGENLFDYKMLTLFDNLVSDIEAYESYDFEKDGARRDILNEFLLMDQIAYNDLITTIGGDKCFLRLVERKYHGLFGEKEIISKRAFRKLKKSVLKSLALMKNEVVADFISPYTAKGITGENDMLESYDLIGKDDSGKRVIPRTKDEIMLFKQRLFSNPAFADGIYHINAETNKIESFGLVVKFNNVIDRDPYAREIKEIADLYLSKGVNIISHGAPVVNLCFNLYMMRDMTVFLPFVMLAVIIVFYFNFRTIRGVILPLLCLICADLWVLGLMGHLGYKLTSLGIAIPTLMMAIGSSYAIHILNQYYIDYNLLLTSGRRKGLASVMSHVSLTVLLAGFTTFVGFMTLMSSAIIGTREWGVFSAIGVLFTVIISISIIPAMLYLLPQKSISEKVSKTDYTKVRFVDKLISFFSRLSVNHYKMVVFIAVCVLIFSIVGLFKLRVETQFLKYFQEDDPIRVNAKVIDSNFGGHWGFNILIDSGEIDGIKQPEFLEHVEKIRLWLVNTKDLHIGRTDGFSDFIKTMNMAMNNDDPAFYKIPDSFYDINDYLEIFSGDDNNSDGRIDDFESFVDYDFKVTNIIARLHDNVESSVGTGEIKRVLSKVDQYVKNILPEKYSYKITGYPQIYVKFSDYLVQGQIQSLLLCLVVVGIIMILLFENFKVGCLALIPMSVSVCFTLGIMGWVDIPLDIVTSVIASVTIGIGVDDTIHFLNTFRHYRGGGNNISDTIVKTLQVSGRAIFYTSFSLVLGFSVLCLSTFTPVIMFGVLMSISMVATTLGALVVLPACIKSVGIELKPAKADSFIWRYISLAKAFGFKEEY